jgi:hypothetical protein
MTDLIYPPDFLEFWEAYPRKHAKVAAFRAWKKLSPVNGLLPAILSSIAEHRKTFQWQNIRYICYPSTFLNQRRWEDNVAGEIQTDDGPCETVEEYCRKERAKSDQAHRL